MKMKKTRFLGFIFVLFVIKIYYFNFVIFFKWISFFKIFFKVFLRFFNESSDYGFHDASHIVSFFNFNLKQNLNFILI